MNLMKLCKLLMKMKWNGFLVLVQAIQKIMRMIQSNYYFYKRQNT